MNDIGDVPGHWKLSKFGYSLTVLTDYTANGSFADLKKNVQYFDDPNFARLVRLTDLRKDLENENGVWINKAAYDYLAKSSLFGGEFLLANVGAYAGLFYQMPFNKGYASLAPNMFMAKFSENKLDSKFIAFVGQSQPISEQLKLSSIVSSAQPKLNKDDFRSVYFVYPSIDEQRGITDFLDRETRRINTLIEEKNRFIELLKEKRLALICHAVTKGLDPTVIMKDSGVDWLGDIPAQWGVKKIKHLFEIRKRIAGEEGYPVLSITQTGIKVKDTESGEGQLSMDYSKYQFVEIGDFAMNHMDLLTGYVDISQYFGVTSPDYRVFTLKNANSVNRYYLYLMQMGYKEKIFFSYGQGVANVGRWRFQTEPFINFNIPYPNLKEQQQIVDFLDKETVKIDALVQETQTSITLLIEHRSALISAAVTGKIDVREAA